MGNTCTSFSANFKQHKNHISFDNIKNFSNSSNILQTLQSHKFLIVYKSFLSNNALFKSYKDICMFFNSFIQRHLVASFCSQFDKSVGSIFPRMYFSFQMFEEVKKRTMHVSANPLNSYWSLNGHIWLFLSKSGHWI